MYREPTVNDEIVVVDEHGNLRNTKPNAIKDVIAGIVVVSGKEIRYVDPAGATAFESNSWHFPTDDVSRIAPESVKRQRFEPKA